MSDSDSEMADESAAFSQASSLPPNSTPGLSNTSSSPWRDRMSQQRVPTPIIPPSRPSVRTTQTIGSPRQHVRQRHPQEYNTANSSDHLEVPSPIDEDEAATPPSAAEAAGSQLSMLTVNDMEVDHASNLLLPSISIDRSATLPLPDEDAIDMDADDGFTTPDGRESRLVVRKQRQRSGALSSGQGSPVRPDPGVKKGLSMGYRQDCEKCRMKVVGHFNHFVS